MSNAVFTIPVPVNEPVLSYAPKTPEREKLTKELEHQYGAQVEIPLIIGGKEINTGDTASIVTPHQHQHELGVYHKAGADEVELAINAAKEAKKQWEQLPHIDRAAIFLKMADLITTKYRYILNAATMLGQSKNPYQAEIDSAAELADFYRFNAYYMQQIYKEQPLYSPGGVWNRMEFRPLEGFVFAVSPFNFTSIAGNLPTAPALMGNVALWKPASTAVLSGYYLMQLYKEAGLPDGVINFIPGSGSQVGDPVFASRDFAGIHFTGSTGVFNSMWRQIAENMDHYNSYPRIVGETGGKDFIFAHETADIEALVTAAIRGAYEYQGQKCSAASRMYIPSSLYPEFKQKFTAEVETIKMGDVRDFSNFMNAVIDEKAFDTITSYISRAKESSEAEIVSGGGFNKTEGYFVEPTAIRVDNPKYETMETELFGPVLTIYVYDNKKFDETLELCDSTSPYALTGAVFAQDRKVINYMAAKLRNAAGNFYINDKPTGAVVGQQPFGGARGSGTNDKAGSWLNLIRWASPRTIKETFSPAKDYRYPFSG